MKYASLLLWVLLIFITGCWLDRPDDVRSANRGENAPDYTRHKVGFRCAMDAR